MPGANRVHVDISQYQEDDDKNYHYYYTTPDSTTERIDVVVELDPAEFPGYKRLTHKPRGSNIEIGGIEDGYEAMEEFMGLVPGCHSISVYYWMGGVMSFSPLIIQLNAITNEYYKFNDSTRRWDKTKSTEIAKDLITELDKQNCKRNTAHVVDISRKDDISYRCYACNRKITINLKNPGNSDPKYRKDIQRVTDGDYIGRLKNGKGNIDNIIMKEEVSELYIYGYPLEETKPLLLYIPPGDYGASSLNSGRWFKRASSTGNKWEQLDRNEPDGHENNEGILSLLQQLSKESQYFDPSEEEFEYYRSGVVAVGAVAAIAIVVLVGSSILGFIGCKLTPVTRNCPVSLHLRL
ncbi:hypothetical protein BEWA_049250 [Theileria equi strain WA]|uniref:Uncharacterized protein n=1 Tax=Theileria equi strain WA TaxID=1537102 RepID=L1LBC0_THEEQ|nr:hypothetical protein BEWA_049250 [Theileria equi strain WA]EKX72458.1 hypothetical protein BEWA_049250 [Theileria equi strain WA]|eukprot:XP_004831910.1 hypothetical protein BEWA_049250 [Theileria equi strain WA]